MFFTVSSKPGKLFLLTAKHVLFCTDEENGHYVYDGSGPRRNVLLLGTNGFEAWIKATEDEIRETRDYLIEHLKERLGLADKMENLEQARTEREDVQPQLDKAEKAVEPLEQFLAKVKRERKGKGGNLGGNLIAQS